MPVPKLGSDLSSRTLDSCPPLRSAVCGRQSLRARGGSALTMYLGPACRVSSPDRQTLRSPEFIEAYLKWSRGRTAQGARQSSYVLRLQACCGRGLWGDTDRNIAFNA